MFKQQANLPTARILAATVPWIPGVIAIIATICFSPRCWHYIYSRVTDKHFYAEAYTWSENTHQAVTHRYESSQSLFQVAVSLIAASCGIFLFTRSNAEIYLRNWSQRIAVPSIASLLLLSCYHSLEYTDMLIAMYYEGAIHPMQVGSILAPMFNEHYRAQVYLIVLAIVLLAIHVAISHHLHFRSSTTETEA